MRTTSHISAVALAAALLASTQAAQAQLNVGVNLGGNGSGGLGLGVDLGVGNTNIGVDAGVGGNSLVNVDAGVGSGSGSSSSGSSSGGVLSNDILDVDLGVGTEDELIDLEANLLGEDGVDADVVVAPVQSEPAPAPSSEPLVGVRVTALDEAVRLDAIVDLIAAPNLGDVDLDEAIDDRAVSIVSVSTILGDTDRAEIDALIEAGGTGREELLAAIEASVELGSILDREGIAIKDVVGIYIGSGGDTEVLVLDAVLNLGADGEGDDSLLSNDLAELDIDLLTEEEFAEVDLALLPNEEQRLDAIIRLLETGGGTPSGGTVNSVNVIDLDALLGDDALAEVDAVLGGDGDDLVLTADLLDVLDEQGLSPEAVVAVRNDDQGNLQLFVDLGLGETVADSDDDGVAGGVLDNLADIDINLLTDEELAEIDLALLPEDQRLEAIIRLLGDDDDGTTPGTGTGTGTGSGPIQVVDVDALLGDESLAELDLILDGDNGEGGTDDLVLSTDLLDFLEDEGLSPEAVIGIGDGPNGGTQVFVDAGLGDMALAEVTVDLGNGGDDGNGTDTGGGTGGAGTGGGTGGTGTNPGSGSGGTGTNPGTGSGTSGTGGTGTNPGTGTGTGNGGGSGTGGAGAGGTGSTGNGGSAGGGGSLVNNSGALTTRLPSALIEVNSVVAEVECEVGVSALASGEPIAPREVNRVRSVELVQLQGCVQTLSQQSIEQLRRAVEANTTLRSSVTEAGLDLEALIGGNVEGTQLTLYFQEADDAA